MSFHVTIQQKIYSALDGNLSCEVYDRAPQDATFPYVTIGEVITNQGDTATETSLAVSFTINVWSREHTILETKQIQDEVFDALYLTKFSDVSYSFTECYNVASQVFFDIDNITRHGVQEFQFNIERL